MKKADTAPAIVEKDKASGSTATKDATSKRPATKKAASTPVPSASTSKSKSAPPAATKKPAKKEKPKAPRLYPKDYARWLIEHQEDMCRKKPEKEKYLKGKRVIYCGLDLTYATETTRNKMRIVGVARIKWPAIRTELVVQ